MLYVSCNFKVLGVKHKQIIKSLIKNSMKSTKIMVGCIVTFLLTWLTLATLAYLLSSVTDFRTCATNNGTIMFMLIFGWIPSVIVGYDLDKRYKDEA